MLAFARRAHLRRRRGFTIVEILVALAVFVIGVVSILALFSIAMRAHKKGVDQTRAGIMANSLLDDLRQAIKDPEFPMENISDQTMDGFPTIYKYDVTFTPFEDPTPDDGVPAREVKVVITIKWPKAGVMEEASFETVLLRGG